MDNTNTMIELFRYFTFIDTSKYFINDLCKKGITKESVYEFLINELNLKSYIDSIKLSVYVFSLENAFWSAVFVYDKIDICDKTILKLMKMNKFI